MKNDYISEIHEKDKLILHPYEDLKYRGTYNRKLIIRSENIYLYDEDGNVTLMVLVVCGAIILGTVTKKLVKL